MTKKKISKILEKPTIQKILFLIFSLAIIGFFFRHFLMNQASKINSKFIVECQSIGKENTLKIENKKFNPPVLKAKACEEVVIENLDNQAYRIAIGDHDKHINYPGYRETNLVPFQKYSFILYALGKYEIHDHIKDEIEGIIEVERREPEFTRQIKEFLE